MRTAAAVALLLLSLDAGGCTRCDTGARRERDALRRGREPDPLPFELAEYKLVDRDIVRGLGGTWVSLEYEAAGGSVPGYEAIRDRIATALEVDGWVRDTMPDSPYVLSREYDTSDDDQFYTRGPYPGEEACIFHKLAAHTCPDARAVCLYVTVGW